MLEKKLIKEMIADWRNEYNDLKEQLVIKGGEANSVEYSLLATEALRLSVCMNDASDLLVKLSEKEDT